MRAYKFLNIQGAVLNKAQLESYLEKISTNHNLKVKSDKETYPIPRLLENYEAIKEVYNLLNSHLKLGIAIHPAGEWLLDNFYAIEEIVKAIQKELPLKKYTNFVGLQNGIYEGFARIYVLAAEIVAYTDSKIERKSLEQYLQAYQTKKTLSMDEIWNIGIFLQIAIIEKIRAICEDIYISQMQKYKVENIIERLVEGKDKNNLIYKKMFKTKSKENSSKYPFIEYMSYALKKYGKKTHSFLQVLEDTIEKTGTTVSDTIKKEHFNIAVRKVSMGNSITSLKEIQTINFLEIFEKINGVEEILKQDPVGIYENMDYKTKECYRNKIKEISKKTKISEIYIAKKTLEIAQEADKKGKEKHIGYYLIDKGIDKLYGKLNYKKTKEINSKTKVIIYISAILFLTILFSVILGMWVNSHIKNALLTVISIIILLIPISELIIQIMQYILSKIVKPKLIPKIDFYKGIDKENTTIVVIPTIIKTRKKVKELIKKLEVFYLANKSENLYFALLGDCSQSKNLEEEFDKEIIEEGLKQTKILNEKYPKEELPRFNFLYRNRVWNDGENSYLGWERKRGLLTQFNEYLLENEKNKFRVNTIEEWKQKYIQENRKKPEPTKIKYVITLDADTELTLNSAFELVGAMAHILNTPIIDEQKNIVIDGHALIQPRIGVNLNVSYKNLFTQIFAGAGGIDSYTNAISDIYQDNFGEGIFTGKGIYNLKIFSKILKKEIPENKVLSHDLLEGSYLRCGLATDIMLIDGYPAKYNSFMARLSRWIRGDWQISSWILKGPLNLLSKYKIFDNLRRSLFEVATIIAIIYFSIIGNLYKFNSIWLNILLIAILVIPFILETINHIIFRQEGEKKQKAFTPKIDGLKGALLRAVITLGCLPYKAYISDIAKWKTIYRMNVSHKHMLEWTTSEEAENQSKTDMFSYYKLMFINIILAVVIAVVIPNILGLLLATLWLVMPAIMCYISKEKQSKKPQEKLTKQEHDYVLEIAKRTWSFFEDYLTQNNNYLIPDNYQEDRIPLVVPRTSSTNIGLSILSVISAYDLKFIEKECALNLLENIVNTICQLPKWNGHLYNWYNIQTKEPLIPRYISTVDSGNFIGYMYVLKTFLYEENAEKTLIQKVENIINDTNFAVLYSKEHGLFSIGFNIEDNRLTDSYYDLLASEARQASFIAIAKGDVPAKHWNNLNRTMTTVNNHKGLVSWSGTAFEYLMPNINIPKYKGSLLDESCKFLIMSQIEYSKKLGIPWGITEAAFNAKDLHSNYQYKAFGIPWLGLKRGLADEMVVASYGSILAITEKPKEVVNNLKVLEQQDMLSKYGMYESIDYTPSRMTKGKIGSPVKTYMAHHQGLILLSINNLFKDNILEKRFIKNPELEAVSILLQERMPESFIITKENKEKVEKLKYKDYENYSERVFTKVDERLIEGNIISNANYTVAINQKGEGISQYNDICINRYKKTDDYPQGIFFYIKNIKNNRIWSTNYNNYTSNPDKYIVSFMPDQDKFERIDGNIKTKLKITVAANEPVEIRRLELENIGNSEEILEVTSYFEPVLSKKEQDYAHQAFNNLFLTCEYNEEKDFLTIKRNKRAKTESEIYVSTKLLAEAETIGDNEYEIDKEKFIGRGNLQIPKMIENSIPLSKKTGLVTEPIVAMKKTIKIKPEETIFIDLVISAGNNKKEVIENLEKYTANSDSKRIFELSKARVEAESRYLEVKAKDIEIYQKILSYIIFENPIKRLNTENVPKRNYKQSELWKYGISGDLPIILVKIKDANDIDVIKQILKAYEYFKSKNIEVELVILDEEKHSYENYVKEEIESSILNNHISYMKNIRGGIFVLQKSEIDKKDIELLKFTATLIIDSHLGSIENVIKDLEEEYLEKTVQVEEDKQMPIIKEEKNLNINILSNTENLKYYNEYGAFTEDGKEYLIKINKENRLPTVWSHVLANKNFGTVITENMGGYTWYKNSRLNRITSWHNSASLDVPSEIIYVKDLETKKTWSLGCNPMPDENDYNIIYGFGYAKYIHSSCGIEQEVQVFVPKEDNIKVNILKLKNTTPNKKTLKIVYYIKPAISEDEIKSNQYISIKYEQNSNIICAQNLFNEEFDKNIVYVSSSEKIKSYTGDKNAFLGKGTLENPDGLKQIRLNNDIALGKKPCIAIEIEVELESFSEKEIALNLGAEDKIIDAKDVAYKYSKLSNCNIELGNVKNYWNNLLEKVKVKTPIESINILLNGWVVYQTLASRMLGRSGFYQSGGAFGFRDQLQDALSLKYINPEILKNQIIKHSKHQFIEGDVEHWWHEETKRGIRTRFSDDLVWLAFAVIEYINFTGDNSILDIETNYLEGSILEPGQDEKYDLYLPGKIKESIYMHCIRAINKALNFGENGLPKIGSGDWNDGFSEVGNKGKGESIWLGFFLYYVLDKFIPICKTKNDEKTLAIYEENKNALKRALNTNGWDGRWYRRAYMDNGNILGSMENEECRIDGISQSWSVISNAGDNDKKYISMESLEKHLVDKEIGIIKLLDPPFEKSNLEPGYIKAYMPGVRENGGQYTHAAIWVVIAEAMLGFGDKAVDLYKLINPIEHSSSKDAAKKYKVEPYVIAADVYATRNLAGRGGWTWYTGSASWYYKAGIEYILGLKIEKGILKIEPCIPRDWKEYSIHFKWQNSIYNIKIKNPNEKNTGITKILLDGVEVENNIVLDGSGKIFLIEAEM